MFYSDQVMDGIYAPFDWLRVNGFCSNNDRLIRTDDNFIHGSVAQLVERRPDLFRYIPSPPICLRRPTGQGYRR